MPRLTKRAAQDLEGLGRLSDKARSLIRRLDEEPALGKKLVGGLKGKRSVRLGRSHRIIYETTDSGVVVLTIRPRKDAYR